MPVPKRSALGKSLLVVHHGICSSKTCFSNKTNTDFVNVVVHVLVETLFGHRRIYNGSEGPSRQAGTSWPPSTRAPSRASVPAPQTAARRLM